MRGSTAVLCVCLVSSSADKQTRVQFLVIVTWRKSPPHFYIHSWWNNKRVPLVLNPQISQWKFGTPLPPPVLHSIVNKSEREWPFLCVACANCFVFLFKKNKHRRKHQKKKDLRRETADRRRLQWHHHPITQQKTHWKSPPLSFFILPSLPKVSYLNQKEKVSQPDVPWQLLCVG